MTKKLILFLFFTFLFSFPAFAENSFYPEALQTLQEGKTWVEVTFKGTKGTTVFRAWFSYPAEEVWKVLIDANLWKKIHSDYTDSRTLDINQYKMVAKLKPTHVKAFYEIVGEEIFPSFYGRQKEGQWESYVFQRLNLPWPLADRWNVLKIKNDESNSHQGIYRYEFKMVTGNFKDLKGWWELLPVSGKPGWTEFRGQYESDPGISIPKVLAKKIFKSSMRKSVENDIKVLEKNKK